MTLPPHRPWWMNRAGHTNAMLLVLGFGLVLLTRQLVSEFDHFTIGFSGVSGWSVIVYLLATVVVLTQPVNRATFFIILAVAILCRAVLLVPRPVMSSDIYRYAWDGVVQHAHISPYRYVPGDAALKFLRAPNQDLFDNINRRDYAHTIYPPAAQMLFYLITFINPAVTTMKLAMVLLEGLTLWGLVQLLQDLGMRREQSLLYAWCPLIIWEIGSSGHIDSAMMAFLVPALLFRLRGKPILTGLFLGAAVLIKFFPLVLFPALFQRREWKMPAAMVAFALVAYGCYISVGMRVFGFLGGYVEEEGVNSGSRFFLLELARHVPGLAHLPTAAFLAVAAAIMGTLVLWCWKQSVPATYGVNGLTAKRLSGDALFLQRAMLLAFVTMLLFSPHYSWYIAWLVPFLVLMPNLPVMTYVCGLFYLCTTPLGAGTVDAQYSLNRLLYGGVALAFAVSLVMLRWPLHQALLRTQPEEEPAA
jgi:hypothetical protein